MRQFYLAYKESEFLSPLVREIGWTHNVLIISHCKEQKERQYYLEMCAKYAWSKSELIRNLKQDLYSRVQLNQQNFEKTVDSERVIEATLALKDDYNFDF